jgi:outer membrane protein assembly factor BamB
MLPSPPVYARDLSIALVAALAGCGPSSGGKTAIAVRWTYMAMAAAAPPANGPERRVVVMLKEAGPNGGQLVTLEESNGHTVESPSMSVPLTDHAPVSFGSSFVLTTKIGKVAAVDLGGMTLFEKPDAMGYGGVAPIAVGGDGIARVGSTSGFLVGVGAMDGSERWRAQLGAAVTSAAAIASDGTSYVATDSGHLIAISASGGMGFDVALHGFAAGPSLTTAEAIAVGEIDGVRLIDKTGATLFTHPRGGRVTGTRAIANGGILAWGEDGLVEQLDGSGTVVNSFAVDGKAPVYVPPVLLPDGKLAVIDSNGIAYLVGTTGVEVARLALGAEPLREIAQATSVPFVYVTIGNAVKAIDFEVAL